MKVLILSHNPISNYNNMGKTILSLFYAFDEPELCQFYIYPTLPNVRKCNSYYRVTDKEMLTGLIRRKRIGREILPSEIEEIKNMPDKHSDGKPYVDKEKYKEAKLLMRNAIWLSGIWHSKKFSKWMEKEKPDVIFATAGQSSFFYKVILRIAREYKIPLVTYVCDDFYYSTQSLNHSVLQRFYYRRLRKRIFDVLNYSSKILTICDKMTADYQTLFGDKIHTFCTGAFLPEGDPQRDSTTTALRYFGNLKLNRHLSLLQVADALLTVNEKYGTDYSLEIYTGDRCTEKLKSHPAVNIKGFVKIDEMKLLMESAALLLHVESFFEQDIVRVKYSVSTKIAESLLSRTPMFAYGSEKIASIEHLVQNQCAFVCTEQDALPDRLYLALTVPEERQRVIKNAHETAHRYHDIVENSLKLKELLQKII